MIILRSVSDREVSNKLSSLESWWRMFWHYNLDCFRKFFTVQFVRFVSFHKIHGYISTVCHSMDEGNFSILAFNVLLKKTF